MFRILYITVILSCIGTFSSCVLKSAKPPKKKELVVGYQELNKVDSTLIREFEKKYNCSVTLKFISAADYLALCTQKPYNTGFDVVFLSNDSIQERLHERGALYPLKNIKRFNNLDRQFQVKHNQWFPLCHDPLVITKPLDSLRGCGALNFGKWHFSDSLKPHIYKKTHLEKYSFALHQSKLKDVLILGKHRKYSNETAWQLSQLAEIQLVKDTTYSARANSCKFVLSYNMRSVTVVTSLSIGKYARNRGTASLFIDWFSKHNQQFAAARNQLSCDSDSQPNYVIRNLSLIY